MKKLSDIFDIRYGHCLQLNRLQIVGPDEGIPFVSRKMGDNGVAAYVAKLDDVEPNPAGELTCALSGNGVLSTFIQERPYYTAFHVACLRPKLQVSKQVLLYYCICIRANRYRYGWGRQANRTLGELLVPSLDEVPGWVENAHVRMYDGSDAPAHTGASPGLSTYRWKPFRFRDLFHVKKGKRLTKANMAEGSTPFIGAIQSNNGVSGYVGQNPIHDGNTITVNYNGSVAEAFYQPVPYWATDDANVLYPRFRLTPAIGMFLITVIRRERYRFNYGRKWHKKRMQDSVIRLPVKEDGKPDWQYMEEYILSLPFSSSIV